MTSSQSQQIQMIQWTNQCQARENTPPALSAKKHANGARAWENRRAPNYNWFSNLLPIVSKTGMFFDCMFDTFKTIMSTIKRKLLYQEISNNNVHFKLSGCSVIQNELYNYFSNCFYSCANSFFQNNSTLV